MAIDLAKYRNHRNLVITNSDDFHRDPENAFLWSLSQLILLKELGMTAEYNSLKRSMQEYLEGCWNPETNCYDNIINLRDPDNRDSYTSPDQLEAYLCFGRYTNQSYICHRINDTLDANLGTYNNLTGNFSIRRFMHPRVILWADICVGENSFIDDMLFTTIVAHTFNTDYKIRPTQTRRIKHYLKTGEWQKRIMIKKTDQEIIHWCRFFCYPEYFESYVIKHCMNELDRRFGGPQGMFKTYFKDHPTTYLAARYYDNTQ